MIRRFVSTAILAAAVLAPALVFPATSHAAFFHSGTGAKVKNVKMTLKNRTSAPMDLMIEDKADHHCTERRIRPECAGRHTRLWCGQGSARDRHPRPGRHHLLVPLGTTLSTRSRVSNRSGSSGAPDSRGVKKAAS